MDHSKYLCIEMIFGIDLGILYKRSLLLYRTC